MAPCRVELMFWCKRQTTAGSVRNKDTEGYVRRWEALRKMRESWVRGRGVPVGHGGLLELLSRRPREPHGKGET